MASCKAPGYIAILLSVQYHQGCFQPACWIGHSFLQECKDGLSLHRLFGEGMPRRFQMLRKEDSNLYRGSFEYACGPAKRLYDNERLLHSSLVITGSGNIQTLRTLSAYDHYALLPLSADTLVSSGSPSWRNAAGHRPAETSILGSLEVKR